MGQRENTSSSLSQDYSCTLFDMNVIIPEHVRNQREGSLVFLCDKGNESRFWEDDPN